MLHLSKCRTEPPDPPPYKVEPGVESLFESSVRLLLNIVLGGERGDDKSHGYGSVGDTGLLCVSQVWVPPRASGLSTLVSALPPPGLPSVARKRIYNGCHASSAPRRSLERYVIIVGLRWTAALRRFRIAALRDNRRGG